MVDKKRLIKLARELIRINSENPPGNELAIAGFVKNYLSRIGLKVRVYSFVKNRPNVIAVLEGKNKRRSLLITPHLDTVPAGKNWTYPPFGARIKNGKLYGLGATDCKGNLSCAMEVIKSLVEDKMRLGYNLIFAATADEESGSGLGLIPLLDKRILRPDAAVVLDADDFHVIITQKGLIHLTIKIQGKRAHGAYPWRGINAIDMAMKIAAEIKSQRFSYRRNKYLKPPTVNIGVIRGGDKVNVVADWCELELDFRFLPGMDAKRILKKVRTIIKKHTKNFQVEVQGVQETYYISPEHPLVFYLKKASKRFNLPSRIKGSEGATVITFFQHKRIPAVATGFGCGSCAHVADEYVKIDNLYKGTLVLEEFLKNYQFKRE